MRDSWTVMVNDGPGLLSEEVRAALKVAACDLKLNRRERMPFISAACDGVIETEWATHTLGSRRGVLFYATVTSNEGDYRVNFLLSADDLDRGAGILRELFEEGTCLTAIDTQRLPLAELYRFRNLRAPLAPGSRALN